MATIIGLVLGACGGSSLPVGAPVVCEIEQSGNACFRCQAQRCGSQLDRCYGVGFHEGRSVGMVQSRCEWNPDTQRYDRNCSYGGGVWSTGAPIMGYRNGSPVDGSLPASSAAASSAPCGDYAVCFQGCGCGVQCAASCARTTGDAATTYFANDPRYEACSSCTASVLAPCVHERCADDCRDFADAGR